MYRHRLLSKAEEFDLARRWREEGDVEARNQIVECNFRFAAGQAERYRGQLDHDELLSAAVLGLLEAASRFDERRGFRFISYAVWWIRHAIQDALCTAGPVRLPHSAIARVVKARAAQERAEQACGREVSLESASGLKRRQFADLGAVVNSSLELDAPTPDDQQIDLEAETEDLELRHRVQSLLGLLYDRERTILELRFGFDGGGPRTYEQVAQLLGLSRERIRQIERGAFERLRRG